METVIGIIGCLFGITVLILHISAPQKLGKLEVFQKAYGKIAGKVLHIFFYGIVPLGIGIYCLLKFLSVNDR